MHVPTRSGEDTSKERTMNTCSSCLSITMAGQSGGTNGSGVTLSGSVHSGRERVTQRRYVSRFEPHYWCTGCLPQTQALSTATCVSCGLLCSASFSPCVLWLVRSFGFVFAVIDGIPDATVSFPRRSTDKHDRVGRSGGMVGSGEVTPRTCSYSDKSERFGRKGRCFRGGGDRIYRCDYHR